MGSIENIQEHCKRHHINFDEMISIVSEMSPSTELVMLGSVPNGRGNRLSDLDFLLLGEAAEADVMTRNFFDHGAYVQTSSRMENGAEIEVSALKKDNLSDLAKKMSEARSLLDTSDLQVGRIPILPSETYMLLSDLHEGVPISKDVEFSALREQLTLELIPDIIALRTIFEYLVFREDAVAHLEMKDLNTAQLLMHHMTDALTRAVLSSVGYSNPRLQWRLWFLDEVFPESAASEDSALAARLISGVPEGTDIFAEFNRICEEDDATIMRIFARNQKIASAAMRLGTFQTFESRLTTPK